MFAAFFRSRRTARPGHKSPAASRETRFRPQVESLEARAVPTRFFWTGAASNRWSDPGNWTDGMMGGVPGANDIAYFTGAPAIPTVVDVPFIIDAIIMDDEWNGNLHIDSALTLNGQGEISQWLGGHIRFLREDSALINHGILFLSSPTLLQITGPGTVTNLGLIAHAGEGDLAFDSTIHNRPGAGYVFMSDVSITTNLGVFVNAGVFRKDAGPGTSTIGCTFLNDGGEIDVATGTLRPLFATYVNGGTFRTASGPDGPGTLDWGGQFGSTISGHFYGWGSGRVVATNLTVDAGGATLDFGKKTGAFLLQWNAGFITGGELEIAAGSYLVLAGPDDKNLAATLNNHGTILHQGDGNLFISATLNNATEAVYDLQSNGGLGVSVGTFVNAGIFRKTAGAGVSTLGSYFSNPGTVEVLTGTLAINYVTDQVNGDTLTGGTWTVFDNATLRLNGGRSLTTNNGTVLLSGTNSVFANLNALATNNGSLTLLGGRGFTTVGNFTNNGLLTLGISSRFTVSGDYTQGSDGTLEVQVGSPPASGRLSVTGTANLAGTLRVTPVDYTPVGGDTYLILTYGARGGSTFTTGPDGFDPVYDDLGGTLTLMAQ